MSTKEKALVFTVQDRTVENFLQVLRSCGYDCTTEEFQELCEELRQLSIMDNDFISARHYELAIELMDLLTSWTHGFFFHFAGRKYDYESFVQLIRERGKTDMALAAMYQPQPNDPLELFLQQWSTNSSNWLSKDPD